MPPDKKIKIGEGYETIPAVSLKPVSSVTLPMKPIDTTNYGAYIAGTQATIDAGNKSIEPKPEATPTAIDTYIAGLEKPSSLSEQYSTDYKASGIDTAQQDIIAKQQALNTAQSKLAGINARLAGISAESKASVLKAEDRLVPQSVIIGEQASIERSRAIRALPLQAEALGAQAEIQFAQGNVQLAQETLRLAQDRLNTVFGLHTKDIDNAYTYKKDVITAVYSHATAKEKILLDAKLKEEERIYQERKDNVNNAQAISKIALDNGQASIASQITALDPKSKTYTQDLARLQGQVKQKVDPQEQRIKDLQIKKLEQEIAGSGGSVNSNVDVSKIESTEPANVKNTNAITAIIRGNSKIGQGTKTNLANLLGVVASAEDMAMSHPEGTFTGLSPFRSLLDIKVPFTDIGVVPFREAGKRTKTIQNEEYINGINLRTQIWASGAALTKEQTRQVEGMVPKVTDTDRQARVKLNELTNFMLTQAKSVLQSEGVNFQPQKVNLFETYDLLQDATSEQKAELKAQGLI